MKRYERPYIDIFEASVLLLAASGPGATDIFAPDFYTNSKSIWDEDNEDNETIDYEI